MRTACDHMMPQGTRHLKRRKTSCWIGPGCTSHFKVNVDKGVKLTAFEGHVGRCARSLLDPGTKQGWWEAAWGFAAASDWSWLGYTNAGSTSLTSGTAGDSDFVLVAQFPYEVEKRAYAAVKLMSKSQQSMFVDGLKTLDSVDCFTAMVAGVPTQREDPNSPVRAPICALLIHDNKEVNIPGISKHPAQDFKWN